jgi:homoserine kinase type II
MLSAYDIAQILGYYDLGPAGTTTHARHGYVNETAFVELSGQRVVVRRCHSKLGETAAIYRHRLIDCLRARNVPVPALLHNRVGNSYTLLNGRVWEIQEYIAGDDFDADRPDHAESAGLLLARYHQAVIGFNAPNTPTTPRYTPLVIRGLTEQLFERDVMGDLHEILAWYDFQTAAYSRMLPDSGYAALPQLVIHGDMHADNLRFDQDAAVALLDFDQATWDARIVDLADALVAFATAPQRGAEWQWGVFAGPLDIQRAQLVLAGYQSIEPLTHSERDALPVVLGVLWMRGALGRVIVTPEGAAEYHLAVLAQGQRLAEWVRGQFNSVAVHFPPPPTPPPQVGRGAQGS